MSTSPPATTPTDPTNAKQVAFEKVVDALFSSIKPFLTRDNLEVEWRLCTFVTLPPQAPPPRVSAPSLGTSASTSETSPSAAVHVVPRVLKSREKITVGVTESDFERMTQYVRERVASETYPATEACTEDVQEGRRRTTFEIAPDGTKTPTASINKKRLCVVDMALPGCPYDLRLSVNTEDKSTSSPAPAPPTGSEPTTYHNVFSRLKRRLSVLRTDDSVCYDLTRVVSSGHHTSFEVELEGHFREPASALTREWVAATVHKMLSLVTLEGVSGNRTELVLAHRTAGKKTRRD